MIKSNNDADRPTPAAQRPHIPGYDVPEDEDRLLSWDHLAKRVDAAKNIWVTTASTNGQPHAVPVWGVWIDNTLYFSIGPRSARNIAANQKVNIHLEDGSDVVILEGDATVVRNPPPELSHAMDDAYAKKYDLRLSESDTELVGEGFFRLHIRVAYAWTAFPTDATRWIFDL